MIINNLLLLLDVAVITLIYTITCTMISYNVEKIIPEISKDESGLMALGYASLEVIATGLLGFIATMTIRRFYPLISGEKNALDVILNGGVVIAFTLFIFQGKLKKRLHRLYYDYNPLSAN